MTTFVIGLVILLGGGFLYGKFVESVFQPDDRPTPAITKADGVDFVTMPQWKNSLIELLNIAGTGPVLGPIQGILFGPIAFITIPIGCVIAGATHDYFSGMISLRNGGAQMPRMIGKYLGEKANKFYTAVLWVLMLLVGAVFVYTPGDLIVGELLGMDSSPDQVVIWIVYGAIFIYYLAATLLPIDAVIGRIYPIFGAILIISAVGVMFGVFMDGGANLVNFDLSNPLPPHPLGQKFIPVFFITVACGIISGFHATQATMISRTMKSEREGVTTFYTMMIIEGFIAMAWAAGAMVLFGRGQAIETGATAMVGIISREFLGKIGGFLAVLGVIVLPITSGDTAFRSLRLMIGEALNIDQSVAANRIKVTVAIFVPAIALLIFAKTNAGGFNLLWRYFAFTNQMVAVFSLAMITVYLLTEKKNYMITMIPMIFYAFIVTSFIAHAPIGLGLEQRFGGMLGLDPESYTMSFALGAIVAAMLAVWVYKRGTQSADEIRKLVFD